MSESDDSSALTWSHTTAEVPPRGIEQERLASTAECAALASELDILGVERLVVRYRIAAQSGGRYHLTGKLEADVVQACVVTLDPVASTVVDSIDVEFRPDAEKLPVTATSAEEEMPILEAAEYEPIDGNRLDLGRVVAETLAAALPAYPRAPGAELETREAGPAEPGPANPFAALAGWKPKEQ